LLQITTTNVSENVLLMRNWSCSKNRQFSRKQEIY